MKQTKSKTITTQNHSTPITAFLEKSLKPLKMISGQLTSMSTPTKPPSNWIPDPRSVLLGVRPVDQACKADAHRLTVQGPGGVKLDHLIIGVIPQAKLTIDNRIHREDIYVMKNQKQEISCQKTVIQALQLLKTNLISFMP